MEYSIDKKNKLLVTGPKQKNKLFLSYKYIKNI